MDLVGSILKLNIINSFIEAVSESFAVIVYLVHQKHIQNNNYKLCRHYLSIFSILYSWFLRLCRYYLSIFSISFIVSCVYVDIIYLFSCFLRLCRYYLSIFSVGGARCSSVVRAFAHGAMGRRIDPSWGGPIELFLVPASAPRLV